MKTVKFIKVPRKANRTKDPHLGLIGLKKNLVVQPQAERKRMKIKI
jgi:hypothetical protein